MKTLQLVRKATRLWAERGAREVFRLIRKNILHRAMLAQERLFDLRFGTDTNPYRTRPESQVKFDRDPALRGTAYIPTSYRVFRKVMRQINPWIKGFTFVDLGCGKGRVLLLACDYQFEEIIGVEYSRELCLIAARNLEIYSRYRKQCDRVTVVHEDAASFEVPNRPTLFFMFNPFGRELMAIVLEKIKEAYERSRFPYILVWISSQAEQFLSLFQEKGFSMLRHFRFVDYTGDFRDIFVFSAGDYSV
jgi:predicted RNA methylase